LLTPTSPATAPVPLAAPASSRTMTSSSTSPTSGSPPMTPTLTTTNSLSQAIATKLPRVPNSQAFVNNGKNGNGGPSEFNSYGDNSNTIGASTS
jgi:hypothetical protein